MQLYIGNKNYSSWSMRPWVLMRQLGLVFDDVALRFDFANGENSEFARRVREVSPAGRVPVLVDEGFSVWDSLAIVEYLHEKYPAHGVWPEEPEARARARTICAEMHSGFSSLRNLCPMNIEARLAEVGARLWSEHATLRGDVARIEAMWAQALAQSGGPMLFGRFTAADAFYAPVCMRFRTYGLPVGQATAAYMTRVLALPSVLAWEKAALAEHDWIAEDEPYRQRPAG
jgi:glutathione S-transferase